MKKFSHIAVFIAASITTVSAFAADTTAIDDASWFVTARKDTDAKIVINPQGSVDFTYAKSNDHGSFNQSQALFNVSIDNTGRGASAFKLETRANAQKTLLNADGSKVDVILSANGVNLDETTWVVLNDDTHTYHGLESITGLSKGVENGSSYFEAHLANGVDASGAALSDLSTLADGVYTGVVTADFQSTWTS